MTEHVTKATGQKGRWLPNDTGPSGKTPVRLPPRKGVNVAEMALPLFSVATGAMIGLSAPQLIEPHGLLDWLKIGVLASSAALVSYTVNRWAVEHGAELAGRGYLTAGVASVVSMLAVGTGLFASTFAGLTIQDVNNLKLQQHGQDIAAYVEAANLQATKSIQLKPILDAAVADIGLHVGCEEKESCLSGRGDGGRGRVTRALEPIATRASEISRQVTQGDLSRSERLQSLNGFVGQYQTVFNTGDLDPAVRRQQLSQIDTQIKQDVGALLDAMPMSLISAYGGELDNGLTLADRPEATANVSALLRRHGTAIKAGLAGIEKKRIEAPAFPETAGVSSTFTYIGHFLPMAALAIVIELVMPVTLWIYIFLGHLWRNYRDDPPPPSAGGPGMTIQGGSDGS